MSIEAWVTTIVGAFIALLVYFLQKRDNKKEKEEKKEEKPKGTEAIDINSPITVSEKVDENPEKELPVDNKMSEDDVTPQKEMATEEGITVEEKEKDQQVKGSQGQHSNFITILRVIGNNTYVVEVRYDGERHINVDIVMEEQDICSLRNDKTRYSLYKGSSFLVTLEKKIYSEFVISWFTINWNDFGDHSEIVIINTNSNSIIQKDKNEKLVHREGSVFNTFLRISNNNTYVVEVVYVGERHINVDIVMEEQDICSLRNDKTRYSLYKGSSFLVTLDKKIYSEFVISWFTINWSDFGDHSEIVKIDTIRNVLTL